MLISLGFTLVICLIVRVSMTNVEDILSKFHQSDYKITFSRGEVIKFDPAYYKYFTIKTGKYNRTQAVINMAYEFLIDVDYDLLCMAQAYKFLSNEYRVFPMRFQLKLCTAIEQNLAGFGRVYKLENPSCPIKKNISYRITNYFPDESMLPPYLPNGQYLMKYKFIYMDKNISTMQLYGEVFRPILPN